ncbi:MAG: sn-glycerol-3-phosphate ABC transporter ATP-binding protein UgpC [Pyrinomonadaceae bacterium]|nr:sn-glycerol-3-phosphate ABC transporter ATP-binding protein UgpC [Pyrinomonadaceae bacterium]
MADLTLQNVTKIYPGGVRAVSPTSVEIKDGEFMVLVGPSGCGKSTLLRMIAGLEEISEGEILIDGRVVNNVPARDRDIAMVFQNYALYPHMSVRDNMAFGLKMRKFPKQEITARVNEAATMLDLSHLLDRKPAALSGGQRQRVAVGRAIVRQPKLFLFDEPLSNLDAKLRVSTRAELIKLHRRLHATIVYVTHDQVEAMSMGDRLIVLKDGVVQQVGAPLEIYNHPANQFVASFIGSPPMNFVPCSLAKQNGELFLTGNQFSVKLPDEMKVLPEQSSLLDRQVVFGIRPEDVHQRHLVDASVGTGAVPARVEFLELLGSEVLATCSVGDYQIIARLPSQTDVRNDQTLELTFDMKRAKLFEAETGKVIL